MAILEVVLSSGRDIWASAVHIQSTYAGLLEGYPIAVMNDRLLARLLTRATDLFGDWPVHMIEPTRSTRAGTHATPFGPPEYLPSCWIAADFTSLPLSDAMPASQLILIWFQEQPFPVPSEPALRQLETVAWESFARDFEN